MTAVLEQLKHGAEQAWASVSDGWHDLRARASGALTRFRHDDSQSEQTNAGVARSAWGLMAADIVVEDERLIVRIEAPGMSSEDMQLDVSRDRLSVRGHKRVDQAWDDGRYRLLQCCYGSFQRELPLPLPVDAERAKASYRDGVLRVELARLERGRPHHIMVQGS
ncbi:Hsp20/alpha crystallin family protein [Roseateles oligotrophus]|uniref:Hsp20/alpha crystallin family protein n=1 Tax=Roseateles oligotrophus TaxID=1769250 RepID=A0ABT2YF61_9BURK|nr:Hsp20/alpha crystallin family protein [Roseateles oligotrophus]MCV2368692.1 Hsp20/alpha crystallin family protein [Roseateles oligotrophus]